MQWNRSQRENRKNWKKQACKVAKYSYTLYTSQPGHGHWILQHSFWEPYQLLCCNRTALKWVLSWDELHLTAIAHHLCYIKPGYKGVLGPTHVRRYIGQSHVQRHLGRHMFRGNLDLHMFTGNWSFTCSDASWSFTCSEATWTFMCSEAPWSYTC